MDHIFQAGDLVECIDDTAAIDIKRGMKYTVNRVYYAISDGLPYLILEGTKQYPWSATRFIPPPKNTIKETKMAKVLDTNDPNIPVRKHDDIHCACCGVKAKRRITKAVPCYSDPLGLVKHDLPDLTGWAVMEFPFRDLYFIDIPTHVDGRSKMKEKDKMCPDCGQKVKAFMAHLKTPMYNPDIE